MNQSLFEIISNRCLTENVYEMVLRGDTAPITASGQFVNIKLEGFYLRRPISVCNVEGDELTIIYKVVGKGTEYMSQLTAGKELDVLCGLGNGFDVAKCGDTTVVLGGGVGVPPMYGLAKALKAAGKTPIAILGFNKSEEIFYVDEFKALGVETFVTTVDGSTGIKGFVTDVIKDLAYTYFYSCGPMPMFKAMEKVMTTSGQYSFEERMGCGFGACMGCTCKTKYGNKRICKDGPVLEREEIVW